MLCLAGTYSANGNCNSCSSSCANCRDYLTSSCFSTSRSFLDFSVLPTTSTVTFTFLLNTATIEFWFYPTVWNTNGELLSIPGLIAIRQSGSTNSVNFCDGSGNAAFAFTSNLNQWVHVSWVFLGSSKARIFVNDYYNDVVWNNRTASSIFYVGSNSTTRFNGLITDLRL